MIPRLTPLAVLHGLAWVAIVGVVVVGGAAAYLFTSAFTLDPMLTIGAGLFGAALMLPVAAKIWLVFCAPPKPPAPPPGAGVPPRAPGLPYAPGHRPSIHRIPPHHLR